MATEAQVAGGHKATLNNPNASQEAKEHSQRILDDEYNGGDVPKASDGGEKNKNNVIGGLKATTKNPNVSEEAKESAKQRLEEMQ